MAGTDGKGERQYHQGKYDRLEDERLLEGVRSCCILDMFWRLSQEKAPVPEKRECEGDGVRAVPEGFGLGTWKAEFPATGMRKALQREFGGERFMSAISARI